MDKENYDSPPHLMGNIFASLPPKQAEESCETILEGQGYRLERIISQGHVSPTDFWFDQNHGEWVILLSGAARLQFEGEEEIRLMSGDYLFIHHHERHRVTWTSPDEEAIWLALNVTPLL